jgi:hypothetical protein
MHDKYKTVEFLFKFASKGLVGESEVVNATEEKSATERRIMVSIPVLDGLGKPDSEKFLRQFKRACMSNGDRDEGTWLELLPIHLEDEASWWYESQTAEIKASWILLTKALLTEFQEKESYQVLMGELNIIR